MLRKYLFYPVILLVAAQPAAADDASRCYSETGDSKIASCTRAINSGARNPAINYNNRGNAYHSKRDYDSAIADYSEAIPNISTPTTVVAMLIITNASTTMPSRTIARRYE
jgi:Tetratricopeptide repeat